MAHKQGSLLPSDHFVLLGELVTNASTTEAFMFVAFKILSGTPPNIARAIFYTLDSFPSRKSLLNRVLEETGDQEDKRLVGEIISACEKSNNQRREVAHALVRWEESGGQTILKVFNPKSKAPAKRITKEWASNLIRLSGEAFVEGLKAFQKLCAKHGVPEQLSFE